MSTNLTKAAFVDLLKAAQQKIKEQFDYLNQLDSATGDGDHGTAAVAALDAAVRKGEEGLAAGKPFAEIQPFISSHYNYRDHRKILVIDGKTGFTGGVNLADEYINRFERFGYWKDNLIRVRGEAVWSYTVLFLTTWNALRHEDEKYMVF